MSKPKKPYSGSVPRASASWLLLSAKTAALPAVRPNLLQSSDASLLSANRFRPPAASIVTSPPSFRLHPAGLPPSDTAVFHAQEVIGLEISYKVSAEDIRRDLGISHFEGKMEVKDMEINKKCEKCSNTKLKFSTRQMRSADEGQTTFFHCPVCSYTFTEN
ncbi:unnamed protein product [Linum tenue]|uniref:TFIIS-type domain-containing protein n=1 Tax=Linum tenue TaxID=586396 RepID=A0AAV0GQS2_9ROSI|nr:unnamed protein product [Linum tenue]